MLIALQKFIPEELFAAYLISVLYAVSSIIFEQCCPAEIQKYRSLRDYDQDVRSDIPAGAEESGFDLGSEIASVVAELSGAVSDKHSENDLVKAVRDALAETTRTHLTPEASWIALDRSRTAIRGVCSLGFGTAILLSIILIGWTAPREVFEVHSFRQLLDYLF